MANDKKALQDPTQPLSIISFSRVVGVRQQVLYRMKGEDRIPHRLIVKDTVSGQPFLRMPEALDWWNSRGKKNSESFLMALERFMALHGFTDRSTVKQLKEAAKKDMTEGGDK